MISLSYEKVNLFDDFRVKVTRNIPVSCGSSCAVNDVRFARVLIGWLANTVRERANQDAYLKVQHFCYYVKVAYHCRPEYMCTSLTFIGIHVYCRHSMYPRQVVTINSVYCTTTPFVLVLLYST